MTHISMYLPERLLPCVALRLDMAIDTHNQGGERCCDLIRVAWPHMQRQIRLVGGLDVINNLGRIRGGDAQEEVGT